MGHLTIDWDDSSAGSLLPSECPNCGRLHQGQDFTKDPGPTQVALSDLTRAMESVEVVEWCREEMPDGRRCKARAEVILWGKLLKSEAFGPRCYDHASAHVGHRSVFDPGWAIFDLRGLRREGPTSARTALPSPKSSLNLSPSTRRRAGE